MKLSEKQSSLVQHALRNEGRLTKAEANDLLKRFYYHNHAHYVSEILTRMVSVGHFKRVKRGHYEINMNRYKDITKAPQLF